MCAARTREKREIEKELWGKNIEAYITYGEQVRWWPAVRMAEASLSNLQHIDNIPMPAYTRASTEGLVAIQNGWLARRWIYIV